MNIFQYISDKGINQTLKVIYQYKIDLILQKIFLPFLKNKPLKNIIIMESHNDFDCNGGALYEYLIQNDYNKKYKIVWLLKNNINVKLPYNVEAFRLLKPSLKKDYYICIAKYFTADNVATSKVRKDQKSFYLTHGAVGLKNVAGKVFIPKTVDYILSPSEFYGPILAEQCRLHYDSKRFICLGYPSQDILFQPSVGEINKITKEKYSKIVLWMPTFRKGGGFKRNDSMHELPLGIPIIKDEKSLENLNKNLKEMKMLLIIKIHPMQDPDTIKVHSLSNICVLTGESVKKMKIDNCKLMKDVDALVSDYSSAAYDFLMLEKPIAYDFSDLDDYTNGLCVDNVDDFIAGPKIHNYNEFVGFLKMVYKNDDSYAKKRRELKFKLYKYADSSNCKRIVKFMGL